MSGRLRALVGLAVLVALGWMIWTVSFPDGRAVPRESARTVSFGRPVAEGVSLRRHGCYGIDFVRCGSCRIEKRKLGPLTLGGFSVLVLNDLGVVIPRGEKRPVAASDGTTTAVELAERLGVTQELAGLEGSSFKFSDLRLVWSAGELKL